MSVSMSMSMSMSMPTLMSMSVKVSVCVNVDVDVDVGVNVSVDVDVDVDVDACAICMHVSFTGLLDAICTQVVAMSSRSTESARFKPAFQSSTRAQFLAGINIDVDVDIDIDPPLGLMPCRHIYIHT